MGHCRHPRPWCPEGALIDFYSAPCTECPDPHLCVVASSPRRRVAALRLGIWFTILVVFALLALGPVLHVWGRAVPGALLPYALLERVVPPLQLSGVPLRMVVMVTLAVAVIWAIALRRLGETRRGQIVGGLLVLVMVLESLPRPIPASAVKIPSVYGVLLDENGPGAVADVVTDGAHQLWMQTLHHRPMAFGYVSRVPQSVAVKEAALRRTIAEGRWDELYCHDGFRWVILAPAVTGRPGPPVVAVADRALYDLAAGRHCPPQVRPQ
jgi:hypothetical protein